jgi:SAM-dependent methyltransferase
MQKIEVFKKNIFDQIISDLYKKYDIKDEIEFKTFLSEHKLIMENLAKNIRSRGRVDIDYKKHKIQVSYVLRYFHVYWYQIYHALKKISELEVNFFKDSDKALKIGLFGAGPAPEVIGITNFIQNYSRQSSKKLRGSMIQKISIDLLDQVKEWNFAREAFIFSNEKKNKLNEMGITINSKTFDFSDFSYFKNLAENSYDLISFQNCVNEFVEYSNQEEEKYKKILKALKPGGFIIFSERSITETVIFIDWFDSTFNDGKNYSCVYSQRSFLTEDEPDGPPIFDGIIYDSSKHSPVPEVLQKGNFYSFSERPMGKNKFDSYILKKAELTYTTKDLENMKFFKIEDHNLNFKPINPMSPYNDLSKPYQKVEFLRSKRISNINKNLPFNHGIPNSRFENNLIVSWRKEGKSLKEITDYFQRRETVIKSILKLR